MKAADVLSEIKARDDGSSKAANVGPVLLVLNDPMLSRLLGVWATTVPSADLDPAETVPADLPAADRARWYWARLEPDPIPLWIAAAGLPDAAHVRRACRVLIDAGLVHPDGVVSTWGEKYLARSVKMILMPPQRGAKK